MSKLISSCKKAAWRVNINTDEKSILKLRPIIRMNISWRDDVTSTDIYSIIPTYLYYFDLQIAENCSRFKCFFTFKLFEL